MKKMIAIVVAAIFVFAMAAVSLAAEEKAEMAKPAEDTQAGAPKSVPQEVEKLENPDWLKDQEKQEEFKELTPEELKKLEELDKPPFRKLTPEEIDWGEPEEPAKLE